MARLPKLKPIEIPEAQQLSLGAWLTCYEIHQELSEGDAEETFADLIPETADSPLLSLQISPFALSPLSVGQIRLLSSKLVPEAEEPVFVAVIRQWEEEDSFLITPFSRYPFPAFTSELLTGKEEDELATLCVWNSVTLSSQSLQQSWMAGELSEEEVQDANQVFDWFLFGASLPESLNNRIGAPILYPDDPRIPYQSEQYQRCAGLVRLQQEEIAAEEQEKHEEDPLWIQSLIRQAENIINFPEPQRELMAAASPEETWHPLFVYRTVKDDEPLENKACADEPFQLEPGSSDVPEVQWLLTEAHPEWAEATVLLLNRQTKKVVARGGVDGSGQVINLIETYPDKITELLTEESDLLLCLYLDIETK